MSRGFFVAHVKFPARKARGPFAKGGRGFHSALLDANAPTAAPSQSGKPRAIVAA